MNRTAIQWTTATWNPVTGCTEKSAACAFCYAREITERFPRAFPNGFRVTEHPNRLEQPLRWRKPGRVFVCSMADLFHTAVTPAFRHRVFDTIEQASRHTFQILTKRPALLLEWSRHRPLPPNVWAGTTVEDSSQLVRADYLRHVDAAVRFISAEPLLDPLPALDLGGIHWLIAGGLSGAQWFRNPATADRAGLVEKQAGKWRLRPDRLGWLRSLRDRCAAAGVAFFFKQAGGPTPTSGGCELDGRAWKEFPA